MLCACPVFACGRARVTRRRSVRFRTLEAAHRAFDVVGVGASLGGLEAVTAFLAGLPRHFPAAVVVAQHRGPSRTAHLEQLLAARCRLRVVEALAGERVMPGTVYVAPGGVHCTVERDRRIAIASRESPLDWTPSIDRLFDSLANSYRERAIGIVLSGRQRDGARGVQALKRRGARVLVQDQETAKCFDMPAAALATGCADFAMPVRRLASAVTALVMVPGAAALFAVPVPHWASLKG